MKKILSLILSLLFVTSLAGCQNTITNKNNPDQTPDEEEIITIVTTILPLYSLTRYLTYNTPVTVNNIVPPNVSAHTFQLTPNLLKQIERANYIIINGVELEEFLEDSLANSEAKIIDTSKNIELIKFEQNSESTHSEEADNNKKNEDEHHDDEELNDNNLENKHSQAEMPTEKDNNEEAHKHNHGEYDPHIWLNPLNALKQAENIYNILVQESPKYQKEYEENFKWLKYNLEKLDKEIETELAKSKLLPYITFHSAFSYFDKRYGTKALGVIEEFPGKEPSIEYMKNLANKIQENNIRIIFKEPQTSPKIAEILAQDYNLVISELDPMGKTLAKDAYFKMMRKNLRSLVSAFLTAQKNNEKAS